MSKDCLDWTRHCLSCQKNKVSKHEAAPLAELALPSQRFEHIHVNLVTLPLSKGFKDYLTIIDRFTWYPEVVPLPDIRTETVVRALLYHWIARFGVPLRITSNRGGQFIADIYRRLTEMLGIRRKLTTPIDPQANGLVERLHRQLKAALRCHGDSWYDVLPLVLLGLRTAWKPDAERTPAELTYGEAIRLPGELFTPTNDRAAPEVLRDLCRHFAAVAPTEMSRHGTKPTIVHKSLADCTHVFIRTETGGPNIAAPYSEPYRVVSRHDRHFVVHCRSLGRGNYLQDVPISIDRLKPAFILPEDMEQVRQLPAEACPRHQQRQRQQATAATAVGTSGQPRKVTFNDRLETRTYDPRQPPDSSITTPGRQQRISTLSCR
ncbi:uncharacterized protein LOC107045763 [Diachasma alloeum]|uniref:uncharacterized protein LOC107045763 n=1 Tax=Diachasma alloeum TaxID=454923 RepID=UPI0007384288|nr:uncharacterized protein LOC107045763 [Diachasma alloeum]